eukprot:jgi/Ulvmu1/80/UM001_0083.1
MVRTKTRHAVVSINFRNGKFQENLTGAQLFSALRQLVLRLYGTHGVATIVPGLSVVHVNPITRLALLRYWKGSQRQVHTVINSLQTLVQSPASLQRLCVSGRVLTAAEALLSEHKARVQALPASVTASRQAGIQATAAFGGSLGVTATQTQPKA